MPSRRAVVSRRGGRRRCDRHRGGVYVAVLGVAMLGAALSLGSLLLLKVNRSRAELTRETSIARRYAHSAMEIALLAIYERADWTQTLADGEWRGLRQMRDGTLAYRITPPDDSSEPGARYRIAGRGVVGKAVQMFEAQIDVSDSTSLASLDSALHSNQSILWPLDAKIDCDQQHSSNGGVSASGAVVKGDVEAAGTVIGYDYEGQITSRAAKRTMPDAHAVVSYYKAIGTEIPLASLPRRNGAYSIQSVVLSPEVNPFTAETNSHGVYVIDCQGQSLRIENCRIQGTLVLLNTSGLLNQVTVAGSVNWQPADAAMPALIADGGVAVDMVADELREDDLNVNFNPPGAPYDGAADADVDDSYDSVIRGLVYVAGQLHFQGAQQNFEGIIVCDSLWCEPSAGIVLSYDSALADNPPVGFRVGSSYAFIAGTIRRIIE